MNLSAVEKETPRGLIQALLSTSSVSRSARVRRTSRRNGTPATMTDLSKRTRSSTKRKTAEDGVGVATPLEDATPRTLIGKVLDAQSMSKSVVANKRRKTPIHTFAEPKLSSSVISAATKKKSLLKTPSENATPRTAIRSILQTAAAETPVIHTAPLTPNHSTTLLTNISGISELPTIEEQGDEPVEEQAKLGRSQLNESHLYETDNKNETNTEKMLNEDEGKSDESRAQDDGAEQPTLSRSVDSISNQELAQNDVESVNSMVDMSQTSLQQQIEPDTVREEGDTDQSHQTQIERRDRSSWQNLVTPHIAPRNGAVISTSGLSTSQQDVQSKTPLKRRQPGRKADRIKVPAISEPHLPSSLVKSIFQHFSKAKVSRHALQYVEQGSQLFFKQLASDLMAYCHHAGRSTIETADVELLIKRQGFITDKQNLFSLIEKYLPMEYRQEIIPTVQSGNEILLK